MPISHVSKVFAVTDAKIAPLTADPDGGATTYGALIDVPGIKSVEISGAVESKTLRGDNALLDSDSVITEVTVSFEYAKLSLDVLAAVTGTTVVESGTTPAEIATWDLTDTSKPAPFKFQAVSASADTIGGDVMFELAKCVLSNFPGLGLAEEDYQVQSLEAMAMPTIGTPKRWLTVSLRETAAPLE